MLWLWYRPAAVAPIQPLAWESPSAKGVALKKKKKKMTLQENEGYLVSMQIPSPLPTHSGLESLGLGPSYAVPGTSLRKMFLLLLLVETQKEPSRNDGEEGECLEGLAFSSQPLA